MHKGELEMGMKQDPSSSPLSSVVCCMCGDLGLSEELFRCETCNVRLQHRYCSNLYPKFQRYSTCNWCLRERSEEQKSAGSTDDGTNKLHRNASAAPARRRLRILKKDAVKKQGKPAGMMLPASPVTAGMSKSDSSPSFSLRRRKQAEAFRSKVRKFKLLEEVSR
ncbi:hypothetical protein Cni_G17514 [Canna indica]|uniref:PHD-type zinc finger plants domain-containing protein n=1 Tax=Canna indica TaxID=4628 RepID=A0AAQ3QGN5_9LILI|nr:hypothetical protein Cni_G17514 [Canna indica]